MATELSAAIEKFSREYYSNKLKNEHSIRCVISKDMDEKILLAVTEIVRRHGEIFFVSHSEIADGKLLLSELTEVRRLLDVAIENNGTISFFFKMAALTLSIDRSVDEASEEIHLVGWQNSVSDINAIAILFNGIIY